MNRQGSRFAWCIHEFEVPALVCHLIPHMTQNPFYVHIAGSHSGPVIFTRQY